MKIRHLNLLGQVRHRRREAWQSHDITSLEPRFCSELSIKKRLLGRLLQGARVGISGAISRATVIVFMVGVLLNLLLTSPGPPSWAVFMRQASVWDGVPFLVSN